jgi:hypothetical protein
LFTISDEKETSLSGVKITLIVVAVIAVCIILICIYKKRKHICKKRQDGIDSSVNKYKLRHLSKLNYLLASICIIIYSSFII